MPYVAHLATSSSAAVAAVFVGLPRRHRRVRCKVLLFAWLATISWDAFYRYRMSGLLGGHIRLLPTGRVCLTQVAPEIKESRAADRDHRSVPTQIKWTSPRTYPARIWEYLHQIHQNWPFKSQNCTHFGDNHGRDTDSRQSPKITVQVENHGNREFVIYIHPLKSFIEVKFAVETCIACYI